SVASLNGLKNELHRLSSEQDILQAEIHALEQSPFMADAQALERAHLEAKDRGQEAETADKEWTDAVEARKARAEEHLRIIARFEQHKARLEAATSAATQAAVAAALEGPHREFIASLDVALDAQGTKWKQARERIDAAIHTQMEKARHARRLNERISAAKFDL